MIEVPTKSVEDDIKLLEALANAEPWRDSSAWKSEKEFLNWLRSQSRRIWSRHPVKLDYVRSKELPVPEDFPNQRVKSVVECELCNHLFKKGDTEVDHLIMAGSFKSVEEFKDWIVRLLVVDFNGLRLLCKSCHSIVTLSQKLGITYEDAVVEKKAIEFSKKKVNEQKEILLALNPKADCRNADTRREEYRKLIEEGKV